MKKKNITILVIAIIALLSFIMFATYAYFANQANTNNIANVNAVTERNNMIFETFGGDMLLNVTASNMVQAKGGNTAAENNTTLTVNFTANTDYSMVCSYDIVYEWTSDDKYTDHTVGVTDDEFTIQGTLTTNSHVSSGTNSITNEIDLSEFTYTNNSVTVVRGAQIDGTGSTTSSAVWNLSSYFYNVNANQSSLAGKTYAGRFKVTNVSCVAGTVSGAIALSGPTLYWYGEDTLYAFPNTAESTFGSYGELKLEFENDSDWNDWVDYAYLGKDNSKNYACITYGGQELCLSQPYTQYGLEGHVVGQDFTDEEKESAKDAIAELLTVFDPDYSASGDCTDTYDGVVCYYGGGNMHISIASNGSISVVNDSDSDPDACFVFANGKSCCETNSGPCFNLYIYDTH